MKKWEELSKALCCGAEGSIVMVTTRSQTTSKMMAKVPEFQHQVGCLSEEESWSLFKKLAFASGSGREGENIRELESIGKKIVHKCQGLPLAVKTLGGLMWSKRSSSEWQSVNCSDVWNLPRNDILPALKLSYDNLLPHMKRCFAYCCLFPKGYKMPKVLLIELWMTNGFLPLGGEVDLYVIGDQIFYCMVSRSFFQDVQEDVHQKDRYPIGLVCKMHDLMHDLARDVMRYDCCIIEPGKELITPDEVVHFSSSCSDFSFLDQDLKRLRRLQSICMFVDAFKGNIIDKISKHAYLRVLRLDGVDVSTLPKSICKLKHLRYLSISGSNIDFLPESITYLQNLQVLNLRGCGYLCKLPKGIRYMKNLRCLDTTGCLRLMYMPVGLKELVCLGRLPEFVVGKEKGAKIRELGDLNLLRGKLKLKRLENVRGLEDANSANLKNKTNLVSLELCWTRRFGTSREYDVDDEQVVEGLEPNSGLKELKIEHYQGKMIYGRWMIKLENLVKIEFWFCKRCESIPSLGKLPSLRVIELLSMEALKCLDDDEFPSLQELRISGCHELVSLPSNLPELKKLSMMFTMGLVSLPSNLPHLESLHIEYANNLVCLPSNLPKLSELLITDSPKLHCLPDGLKELTSLEIWRCENLSRRCEEEKGEDWPKISHVPNLRISRG